MSKYELKSMLIENGIEYVKVVRTSDWRGGYDPVVYFNDEAREYALQEFEYVEFEGDTNKASDNYNKVFESVYDRGVRMVNYPSLAQLIEDKIYAYEQCAYISLKKPYYNPLRSLRSRILIATQVAKLI